jgi:hypothetical protein
MLNYNPSNRHFEYMKVVRHWHAPSEKYTGGDSLLTALYKGWTLNNVVYSEAHWYAGTRCVIVYYFELTRGAETVVMPVITNPYVERLIAETPLQQIPLEKHLS